MAETVSSITPTYKSVELLQEMKEYIYERIKDVEGLDWDRLDYYYWSCARDNVWCSLEYAGVYSVRSFEKFDEISDDFIKSKGLRKEEFYKETVGSDFLVRNRVGSFEWVMFFVVEYLLDKMEYSTLIKLELWQK